MRMNKLLSKLPKMSSTVKWKWRFFYFSVISEIHFYLDKKRWGVHIWIYIYMNLKECHILAWFFLLFYLNKSANLFKFRPYYLRDNGIFIEVFDVKILNAIYPMVYIIFRVRQFISRQFGIKYPWKKMFMEFFS